MYRWNEDYAYLAETDRDWYERIKYTPFSERSHASFGGTLRYRLNAYDNDRFGLLGPPDGHLNLYRLLLHTDLHLNDNVRAFVELGSHVAEGDDLRPGPFDEDPADLTQAFVDLSLHRSRLRVGRQEMKLGSTRLLGVREGPNVRRAFDGLRFDTEWRDVDLRLFALQEVDVGDGSFDNSSNEDEGFWGAYSTWKLGSANADLYYLGLDRGNANYTQGTADEVRHSIGTRIFGKKGPWDWNTEFIYQFGEFGSADISAWTAASATGFSFDDKPWSPYVFLSANIASGDDDPQDGELNTFNPLYPNLMYFEEAAVLAPQNFFNIEPGVTVHPTRRLSVSFDWNFFWRLEENDAVYVRGLLPLQDTATADGRFVAHVPSLSVDFRFNRHVTFDVSYSHFFASEVIDNAEGDDIDFFKAEFKVTF